jgi:prevent-host-death family protein
MKRWQLQDAKAKLSEVVKATGEGPQEITVRGRSVAVVLSRAEFDRLKRKRGSFVAFMRSSPLVGVDLVIERDRTPTRRVAL